MITTQNYFEEYEKLLDQIPEVMQKAHELIAKATKNGSNWKPYTSRESIKSLVDKQIESLNQIREGEVKPKPPASKKKKPAPSKDPEIIITSKNKKLRLIGWNGEGTAVYEDENGYRNIRQRGFITTEQILLSQINSPGKGVQLNKEGEREQEEYRIVKPFRSENPCDEPAKTPKKRASAKSKPASTSKSKNASRKKTKSTRSSKPAKPDIELVRDLSVELRLLSRFLNFYKKERTYKQVFNLFKAVVRAIKKGHVRKTENPTLLHQEIAYIQRKLLGWLNDDFSGEDENETLTISFPEAKYKEFQATKKKVAVYPSVRLGVRYIGMEGKSPEHGRVEALLKAIDRAEQKGKLDEGSGNLPSLKTARKNLKAYLDGKQATVPVMAEAMHGIPLEGKCGCRSGALDGPPEGDYLIPPVSGDPLMYPANAIPDLGGKVYHFTGDWEGLFNQPEQGFSVLLHGAPKSGKSTLAVDFAGYLARNFGPVLYASLEEGVRSTIKNRLIRRGADHPDIQVPNYLPADLSPWNFIFIDSASHAKLTPDFLNMLIAKWPSKNFIFVFHETKGGKWYGSNQAGHATDIVARVEKLNDEEAEVVASGRWGPGDMIIDFENATGS